MWVYGNVGDKKIGEEERKLRLTVTTGLSNQYYVSFTHSSTVPELCQETGSKDKVIGV